MREQRGFSPSTTRFLLLFLFSSEFSSEFSSGFSLWFCLAVRVLIMTIDVVIAILLDVIVVNSMCTPFPLIKIFLCPIFLCPIKCGKDSNQVRCWLGGCCIWQDGCISGWWRRAREDEPERMIFIWIWIKRQREDTSQRGWQRAGTQAREDDKERILF